jgi:cyclic pyranopterin phosphate synthase
MPPADIPNPQLLVDGHGRVHTDLRISVTDRCNLRCNYCMPTEGVKFRSHTEMLSFEEIVRLVSVAAPLGIRKIRITGGEPLVRKGIVSLVEMLAAIPGIDDLAMTTNGTLLDEFAEPLKAAGLKRLNISLDSLDREKFKEITQRDELDNALRGIAAARRVGFEPIKLNALAIRGLSEDEIVPLTLFARENGLLLRFIEFMPVDGNRRWHDGQVLGRQRILEILSDSLGKPQPVDANGSQAAAQVYRFADDTTVGIISSVTKPFCGKCNRLRLTSDGKLRGCLFSTGQHDVRELLRGGSGSDKQLEQLLRDTVKDKRKARGTHNGEFGHSDETMHQIGG